MCNIYINSLRSIRRIVQVFMDFYSVIIEGYSAQEFIKLESIAFKHFSCSGTMDYSLDEARVDEILGERSYSGADIPESVIDEVTDLTNTLQMTKEFFFEQHQDYLSFESLLKSKKIPFKSQRKTKEDWNHKWKESFKKIEVPGVINIIPSWEKAHGDNELKIYPGMGFGTGNHATTYLCLELLKDVLKINDHRIDSCLDFGCGSGILGLALHQLSMTQKIDLYDIDKDALVNCEQNISENNFDHSFFRLLLPKDLPLTYKNYDLVFANILQNVLLFEQKNILNYLSKNSSLIISGLLVGQEKEVIESYQRELVNLEHVKTVQKDGWCASLLVLR